jgi:hypothetical protein
MVSVLMEGGQGADSEVSDHMVQVYSRDGRESSFRIYIWEMQMIFDRNCIIIRQPSKRWSLGTMNFKPQHYICHL